MKIVLLEPLAVNDEELERLAQSLRDMGHEFTAFDTVEKDAQGLIQRAKDADAVIIANNPLNKEVIESLEKLKYIAVAFTGVDHVDLEACRRRGIKVSNARGYATEAVAELTVGMIITLLRNIVACDKVTRIGGTKAGLVGSELNSKTVGIVGTGAIGLRTAEILKAFNCKLLGYSRSRSEKAVDLGIQYVGLEELLASSDIVSLHVPLTEETRGLINKDNIKLMKKNAILINVARGPVVDSEALAMALDEGIIAGAGIDVYEVEPPIPPNHPLLKAKNVLATPHVAFATHESMLKRAAIVFDNVMAWLNGEDKNLVY